MRHPDQAKLALHAGGDLGPWQRWRTERHVAHCPQCAQEIAAFDHLREILPDLAETPELPWSRLAAEMKANIRLGLSAGECVRAPEEAFPARLFHGARIGVALAGIAALLAIGVVIEHPVPTTTATADTGVVVQTTPDGIQVRSGGQSLGLLNPSATKESVTYKVGAQGSLEARYVDATTGHVMVNRVNVD